MDPGFLEHLRLSPRAVIGSGVSTPLQKAIGSPEQKYINDAGEKPPNGGLFVRHQAWMGLSAGVSELTRRERCLL